MEVAMVFRLLSEAMDNRNLILAARASNRTEYDVILDYLRVVGKPCRPPELVAIEWLEAFNNMHTLPQELLGWSYCQVVAVVSVSSLAPQLLGARAA
jgi:hypothetical protein